MSIVAGFIIVAVLLSALAAWFLGDLIRFWFENKFGISVEEEDEDDRD